VTAWNHRAPWTSFRFDARTQGGWSLDPGGGAPREGDRPLLLGQALGELLGVRDSCFGHSTLLGRERPICERGKLDDLGLVVWLSSVTSQRHDNSER
jgi:hypothetical protein